MAVYKYPGYGTGQGWTMKPGNLEGGFWGRCKGILAASPPIFAYWSPQNPPSLFPGFIVHPWPVSYPGYLYASNWKYRDSGFLRDPIGNIGILFWAILVLS